MSTANTAEVIFFLRQVDLNVRNTFRFNCKQVFLTYAQCSLPRETILDLLTESLSVSIVDYCIAQETHQDGNFHIHAYLLFDRPLNSRDARIFDIAGFHPNIERPRSVKAVLKYVQKDNNFLVSPGIEELINKRTYKTILESASTAEEFLSQVADSFPRDYVLQYDKIKSFAFEKYLYAI